MPKNRKRVEKPERFFHSLNPFEKNYFLDSRRFLNLSTRPPASTNFCLPVKKGWHLEQISTLKSPFVDFVFITSPQAHLTVAST